VRGGRHAGRHHIIVAIRAVGIRRLMQENCAQERGGAGVTGLARQISRKVIAWLTEGRDVVVACGTAGGDASVIEHYRQVKACGGLMAVLAGRLGYDVGW